MKVMGFYKNGIEVDIGKNQVFEALTDMFGLKECFEDNYHNSGVYWKIESVNNKDVLCQYRDTSYHGSSNYEVVERIKDNKKIEAYKYIEALIELSKSEES